MFGSIGRNAMHGFEDVHGGFDSMVKGVGQTIEHPSRIGTFARHPIRQLDKTGSHARYKATGRESRDGLLSDIVKDHYQAGKFALTGAIDAFRIMANPKDRRHPIRSFQKDMHDSYQGRHLVHDLHDTAKQGRNWYNNDNPHHHLHLTNKEIDHSTKYFGRGAHQHAHDLFQSLHKTGHNLASKLGTGTSRDYGNQNKIQNGLQNNNVTHNYSNYMKAPSNDINKSYYKQADNMHQNAINQRQQSKQAGPQEPQMQ